MSSDTQFTADGPAIVGFQTGGANIQRGVDAAGTVLGMRGSSGEVGVVANGGKVGIRAEGSNRAGVFKAKRPLVPQIQLVPSVLPLPELVPVTPQERQPDRVQLPYLGERGDLYFTVDDDSGAVALWLCVIDGRQNVGAAGWCQVLLGSLVRGVHMPID